MSTMSSLVAVVFLAVVQLLCRSTAAQSPMLPHHEVASACRVICSDADGDGGRAAEAKVDERCLAGCFKYALYEYGGAETGNDVTADHWAKRSKSAKFMRVGKADSLEQLMSSGSRGRSAGNYLRIGRRAALDDFFVSGLRGRITRSTPAGKYLRIGRREPEESEGSSMNQLGPNDAQPLKIYNRKLLLDLIGSQQQQRERDVTENGGRPTVSAGGHM